MAFSGPNNRASYQARATRFQPPRLITSGTFEDWINPDIVARVHLVVCGGGGAGGGGGGGGGSGAIGAFVIETDRLAVLPQPRADRAAVGRRRLTVSAIGAGGTGVVDGIGNAGGSTTVTMYPFSVTAGGGSGGQAAAGSNGGGSGGQLLEGATGFRVMSDQYDLICGRALPLLAAPCMGIAVTSSVAFYGAAPTQGTNASVTTGGLIRNSTGGGIGGAGAQAGGNTASLMLPAWCDTLLGGTWTGNGGTASGTGGGGGGGVGTGGNGGGAGAGSPGTGYGSGGGGGGVGFAGGAGAPGFVAIMYEVWDD